MIEQLNQLYEDFKAQLSEVADIQQLDNLKTHFLGKKSPMGNILRGLKDATPEQRKELGMKSNEINVNNTNLHLNAYMQTKTFTANCYFNY